MPHGRQRRRLSRGHALEAGLRSAERRACHPRGGQVRRPPGWRRRSPPRGNTPAPRTGRTRHRAHRRDPSPMPPSRHEADECRTRAPPHRRADGTRCPRVIARWAARAARLSRADEPPREQRDEAGIQGMRQETRQVIAPRVHAAEYVAHAEREPGERHVVAEQRGGDHEPEVLEPEAAVGAVARQRGVVVPGEELAAERRQEDETGEERDGERDAEPGRDAAHRRVRRERRAAPARPGAGCRGGPWPAPCPATGCGR
jgi:hypothetical protein